MVVQLGDLLRRLLTAGEREFSRLGDELRFARLYLELQQKRFADRLTIWLADLDGLPPVWVPSLILQPLIENAVVHGLAGHCRRGRGAHRGGGVRREPAAARHQQHGGQIRCRDASGIGLRNVRERLAVQFGAEPPFTPRQPTAPVGLRRSACRCFATAGVRQRPG